jgi:endonuclease G
MKTFERFMEQVEITKKRCPFNSLSESKSSGSSYSSMAGTGLSKKLQQFPRTEYIDTKQVNDYLDQNNLPVTEIINDRLLRERVIRGDDTLDVNYLINGVVAAKSVCRINIISSTGEEGFGTGFLIAPQILITNNHVLPTLDYARYSSAEFNFEKGADDQQLASKIFNFIPGKLFYTNVELDYTIIWVNYQSADKASLLSEFGFLKLNPNLGKTKEGNFVSIIQHPDGKIKKVALRENAVTNLSLPKFIRYVTDTKSGSSGAPVFNDKWEVVALHHAGIPRYNDQGKILNLAGSVWDKSQGEVQVDWIENEGVRVSSIVYDITTVAAKSFIFLCDFFRPLTSIADIRKSMGISINDLQNDNYYAEVKDEEDKKLYYADLKDPLKTSFEEMHTLLQRTHTAPHSYSPSKYVYPKVDQHPDGLLRSIYSNQAFTVREFILADQKIDIERQLRFIELAKENKEMEKEAFDAQMDAFEAALPYNCEHVVCQSWFNKQEPMRGDLHHLFACESNCNSFRGNYAYSDFLGYQPQPLSTTDKEKPSCGNMENGEFEPENNKGIVARAVLYFLVRYPGAIKVYKAEDVSMLKGWAKDQPVTVYEKHRNREIFLSQGNRNPFIDFPELTDFIAIQL